MALLPADIRRGILSTWARVPEIDSEAERWARGLPLSFERFETFGWSPSVELAEAEDEFVLTAELPGVDADDMEISVADGILTLKGEKREEREEEKKDVRVYERRYGSFERRFTLPRSADPEAVTAKFHRGVLSVRLPKRREARGRKIRIGPSDR